MHAHDRTLLAQLGFADPDKRNSLHDLACQYMSASERAHRVVSLLGLEKRDQPFQAACGADEITGIENIRISGYEVVFEHPIVKGQGQYQTSIGFIDLLYIFHATIDETTRIKVEPDPRNSTRKIERELPDSRSNMDRHVAVEVKISPVGVGDIIRQIKLYRTYAGYRFYGGDLMRWIIATAFPLSDVDVRSLRNEKIVHVLLGHSFEQFVEAQNQSASTNVEI